MAVRVVLLAFGIGPLAALGEAAEYHVSPRGELEALTKYLQVKWGAKE